MLSPFPGMNPYLEHPELWAEVHHRLISAIAIQLAPVLRPKYRVAIEKRTYFSEGDRAIEVGIPDVAILTQVRSSGLMGSIAIAPDPSLTGLTVTLPIAQEIKEGYLEIREIATGRVVTSIEVLSPTNKRAGVGRDAYEAKRQRVLSSQSHLVELDLLRGGKAMAMLQSQTYDYRVLVSRAQQRPQAQLYGFDLPDAMPIVPLPLADQDEEPPLDLHQLLGEIYEQAGFDLTIDYDQPPIPPLSADRSDWLKTILETMTVTETE
jgi:hypothetical protein